MNHRVVLGMIAALLVITLVTGCASPQTETPLTFDQLFAHPAKYNGKTITLEAFYFHGWETIVLSDTVELSGYAPGHLIPKGNLIWVDGGIPQRHLR